MGQLRYVISIMMFAMFSIAILGFAINFAADNDSEVSISDDPELSNLKTQLINNVSAMEETTESSYTSIVKSSIEKGDTLESGGTFSLTITNAIPTFYSIIQVGYLKIFGNDAEFEVFMIGFIAIMGFIGFMYFVKTWLGRNPE